MYLRVAESSNAVVRAVRPLKREPQTDARPQGGCERRPCRRTRRREEAEVREVERLLECIRGDPWRWSTGEVQSESGEVPTLVAGETVFLDEELLPYLPTERRQAER